MTFKNLELARPNFVNKLQSIRQDLVQSYVQIYLVFKILEDFGFSDVSTFHS